MTTSGGVRAILPLLTLLCSAPHLRAQTIPGRVVEDLTGRPLPIVAVMLMDSTDTAVSWAESDSLGYFALRPRDGGPYRVYADHMGYKEMLSEPFTLESLGGTRIVLRLEPAPIELGGLLVTAEARREKLEQVGFYRRQQSSTGYFFDAAEIEDIRPTYASDLLRLVPNVRLQRTQLGALLPVSLRKNLGWGGPCFMKLVVDDYPVALDPRWDSLDDWVPPDRIIGMEVFPNGVGAPVQHRTRDSFCGIIMIWTR